MATLCRPTESLPVDRNLLDPHFDGYKLSLDPLLQYSISVESGLDEVKLRSDQYTLQHVKAFGMHNHLIPDPWNPNCVYYIDKQLRVLRNRTALESHLSPGQEVFRIAEAPQLQLKPRHNVTMHFPSDELCVLSDGTGTLYVLSTGNRDLSESTTWQVLFSEEVFRPASPFVLLHSVAHTNGDLLVECLLFCIQEENREFTAYLDWVTVAKPKDGSSFEMKRRRRLKGKTAPFYAALEATGRAVFIASESEFEMISDSCQEETREMVARNGTADKEEDTGDDAVIKKTLYTWTQTFQDVSAVFTLPPATAKADINLVVAADTLQIGLKNGDVLLEGALYRDVDAQMCTWIFENGKLELTLVKHEEGPMWSEVVIGNRCGEYVVDEDQARIIHERLAHLTSDQMNPDPMPGGNEPGISTQDLEECDAPPEGYSTLVRLDGESNTVTNRVSLSSHQFLFNAQVNPRKPPCVCLRHDVDGLLWQLSPDDGSGDKPPWHHHSTFNALGYVQASKRDRKYTTCPANCSYAAVSDCIRHVYLYRQPAPIATPLRNRKAGYSVGQIAKQHLVSLQTTDDIMGIVATDEKLFLLTHAKLYAIHVV